MGILNLKTFLNNSARHRAYVGVESSSEVLEEWRRGIFVDGNGIMRMLFHECFAGSSPASTMDISHSVDFVYGGNLEHYEENCFQFFSNFAYFGIPIHVVFDGVMPIKSDAKKFVNSMENRRTRSFDNRDLSTLRNSAEYTSFEHPLVSAVMREALNRVARKYSNVSITYECAVGEADPLVVYRCIQKNGYSVIGNDTDFLGFGVPYTPFYEIRFVPECRTLRDSVVGEYASVINEIEMSIFRPEDVERALGISVHEMAILGSLAGNDFKLDRYLGEFYESIGIMERKDAIPMLSSYIRWRGSLLPEVLFPSALPEQQDEYRRMLQESIRLYALPRIASSEKDILSQRESEALDMLDQSKQFHEYFSRCASKLLSIEANHRWVSPETFEVRFEHMNDILLPVRARLYHALTSPHIRPEDGDVFIADVVDFRTEFIPLTGPDSVVSPPLVPSSEQSGREQLIRWVCAFLNDKQVDDIVDRLARHPTKPLEFLSDSEFTFITSLVLAAQSGFLHFWKNDEPFMNGIRDRLGPHTSEEFALYLLQILVASFVLQNSDEFFSFPRFRGQYIARDFNNQHIFACIHQAIFCTLLAIENVIEVNEYFPSDLRLEPSLPHICDFRFSVSLLYLLQRDKHGLSRELWVNEPRDFMSTPSMRETYDALWSVLESLGRESLMKPRPEIQPRFVEEKLLVLADQAGAQDEEEDADEEGEGSDVEDEEEGDSGPIERSSKEDSGVVRISDLWTRIQRFDPLDPSGCQKNYLIVNQWRDFLDEYSIPVAVPTSTVSHPRLVNSEMFSSRIAFRGGYEWFERDLKSRGLWETWLGLEARSRDMGEGIQRHLIHHDEELPPEKIVEEYVLKDRRVKHGFAFEEWQSDAFKSISKGKSVLVSAPTGCGKTEIAMFSVFRMLRLSNVDQVYYVCPTLALVNQMFCEVMGRYYKTYPVNPEWDRRPVVGMNTGNVKINMDAQIIITVAQTLHMKLLDPRGIPELKVIILDEVHRINEKGEGRVWEQVIALAPQHVQIIGLSATIGNPETFKSWFNFIRPSCFEYFEVRPERRPVAQRLYTYGSYIQPLYKSAFLETVSPEHFPDDDPMKKIWFRLDEKYHCERLLRACDSVYQIEEKYAEQFEDKFKEELDIEEEEIDPLKILDAQLCRLERSSWISSKILRSLIRMNLSSHPALFARLRMFLLDRLSNPARFVDHLDSLLSVEAHEWLNFQPHDLIPAGEKPILLEFFLLVPPPFVPIEPSDDDIARGGYRRSDGDSDDVRADEVEDEIDDENVGVDSSYKIFDDRKKYVLPSQYRRLCELVLQILGVFRPRSPHERSFSLPSTRGTGSDYVVYESKMLSSRVRSEFPAVEHALGSRTMRAELDRHLQRVRTLVSQLYLKENSTSFVLSTIRAAMSLDLSVENPDDSIVNRVATISLDSQFIALSEQLLRHRQTSLSANDIREEIADWMLRNANCSFMNEERTLAEAVHDLYNVSLDSYCSEIRSSSCPGSVATLWAASKAFGVDIFVILSADSQSPSEQYILLRGESDLSSENDMNQSRTLTISHVGKDLFFSVIEIFASDEMDQVRQQSYVSFIRQLKEDGYGPVASWIFCVTSKTIAEQRKQELQDFFLPLWKEGALLDPEVVESVSVNDTAARQRSATLISVFSGFCSLSDLDLAPPGSSLTNKLASQGYLVLCDGLSLQALAFLGKTVYAKPELLWETFQSLLDEGLFSLAFSFALDSFFGVKKKEDSGNVSIQSVDSGSTMFDFHRVLCTMIQRFGDMEESSKLRLESIGSKVEECINIGTEIQNFQRMCLTSRSHPLHQDRVASQGRILSASLMQLVRDYYCSRMSPDLSSRTIHNAMECLAVLRAAKRDPFLPPERLRDIIEIIRQNLGQTRSVNRLEKQGVMLDLIAFSRESASWGMEQKELALSRVQKRAFDLELMIDMTCLQSEDPFFEGFALRLFENQIAEVSALDIRAEIADFLVANANSNAFTGPGGSPRAFVREHLAPEIGGKIPLEDYADRLARGDLSIKGNLLLVWSVAQLYGVHITVVTGTASQKLQTHQVHIPCTFMDVPENAPPLFVSLVCGNEWRSLKYPSEEEATQILSSVSLTISQCFELLVTLNLLEKDLDLEISLFERACEQLDHNLAANMTLKRATSVSGFGRTARILQHMICVILPQRIVFSEYSFKEAGHFLLKLLERLTDKRAEAQQRAAENQRTSVRGGGLAASGKVQFTSGRQMNRSSAAPATVQAISRLLRPFKKLIDVERDSGVPSTESFLEEPDILRSVDVLVRRWEKQQLSMLVTALNDIVRPPIADDETDILDVILNYVDRWKNSGTDLSALIGTMEELYTWETAQTPTVFSFVERTLQVIKRISEEFIEPSALAEPEVTDHEERLRGRKNRRRLLDFCCILLDTIDAKQNPNPELGATVIRPSFVDELSKHEADIFFNETQIKALSVLDIWTRLGVPFEIRMHLSTCFWLFASTDGMKKNAKYRPAPLGSKDTYTLSSKQRANVGIAAQRYVQWKLTREISQSSLKSSTFFSEIHYSQLMKLMKQRNLLPCLLLSLNIEHIEFLTPGLYEPLLDPVDDAEKLGMIENSIARLRTEDPEADSLGLFDMMRRGYAFHHRGCSSNWRLEVENLFRKQAIRCVVCTSTLSVGIHMPCKTVVISDDVPKYLSVSMYKQMIGRAGRRGLVENADGSVESGHVIFAGRMSFSRLKHLVLDPEDMFCGHADLNPTYVLKSLVVGLSNPETAERAISGIYQAMPILESDSDEVRREKEEKRARLRTQVCISLECLYTTGVINEEMFPTKLAADVSSLEVVAPRNISLAQLLPVADILIKERNDLASRSFSDSPSTPSTPASESSSWRKASTESKFAVASSSSSSSSSPSVVSSSPDVESNTVLSRGATFLLNLLCHFTGNRAYTRSQLSNSEFLERAPSLHSLPLQVSDCINKYNENIIRSTMSHIQSASLPELRRKLLDRPTALALSSLELNPPPQPSAGSSEEVPASTSIWDGDDDDGWNVEKSDDSHSVADNWEDDIADDWEDLLKSDDDEEEKEEPEAQHSEVPVEVECIDVSDPRGPRRRRLPKSLDMVDSIHPILRKNALLFNEAVEREAIELKSLFSGHSDDFVEVVNFFMFTNIVRDRFALGEENSPFADGMDSTLLKRHLFDFVVGTKSQTEIVTDYEVTIVQLKSDLQDLRRLLERLDGIRCSGGRFWREKISRDPNAGRSDFPHLQTATDELLGRVRERERHFAVVSIEPGAILNALRAGSIRSFWHAVEGFINHRIQHHLSLSEQKDLWETDLREELREAYAKAHSVYGLELRRFFLDALIQCPDLMPKDKCALLESVTGVHMKYCEVNQLNNMATNIEVAKKQRQFYEMLEAGKEHLQSVISLYFAQTSTGAGMEWKSFFEQRGGNRSGRRGGRGRGR